MKTGNGFLKKKSLIARFSFNINRDSVSQIHGMHQYKCLNILLGDATFNLVNTDVRSFLYIYIYKKCFKSSKKYFVTVNKCFSPNSPFIVEKQLLSL